MDPVIAAVIAFAVFGVLLLAGVRIGLSLLSSAVVGFFAFKGNLGYTAIVPFNSLNSFILTAIPFFVFMGEILGSCGASDLVYQGATKLFGWVPGGLLQANIAACAGFASCSGSSPATAATVGTVAYKKLKARGYDVKEICGSLAAGGTLGILIPPSITMIIYGLVTETSVAALFAAGVVPGLMLTGIFMAYIGIKAWLRPLIAPPREKFPPWKELLPAIISVWPLYIMVALVWGGIFGGLFTPTEAAAVGCVAALIIGLALRKLSWHILRGALVSSMYTTSMVLFILMGAFVFSSFMAQTTVPAIIADYVRSLGLSATAVLLFSFVLYLFLGCFIDPGSMIVITMPTLLPMLQSFGIDLVWYGILVVVLAEEGMITPPMGLNVFVIQGISGEKLDTVYAGIIPYFFLMLFALALIFLFPSIVLWFPSITLGR